MINTPYFKGDHISKIPAKQLLQFADDELLLLKKKLEQFKEQKKGLLQVLLTGKKRLKY